MDDDMDYSDTSSTRSSTYSTYSSPYYSYKYTPPAQLPPATPITSYDVSYEPSSSARVGKSIDLAFILDCTGSMQRYINSVRDHIAGICDMIRGEEGLGGPDDLRVAVVNYRDHPPQDNTYVYQHHPFSADISDIQTYLKSLTAAGGGDGPEAVTAAMAASLTELTWRREAAKIVILIADAPPHGIGESGDQIRNGDPQGHDPLVVARTMAQHGISLFMVACEDTLSGYSRAVDFFQAICNMTSGLMLPLTTADLLAMTIVGSVLDNMDMERLIGEIGREVAERITEKGQTMQSVEEVAVELHEKLMLRNEQTKQVQLPEVYVPHDIAKANVRRWMNAQLIKDARDDIEQVPGKRLTESFRKNNARGEHKYVPSRRLPPRPTSIPGAPPTPSSPIPTSLPTLTPSLSPPTSPPRKVIQSFKPFSSSSSSSVFTAPMLATGPGGGMFGNAGKSPAVNGGMRDRGREDDEDDDDVEDGAGYREGAISLDQARRIATQSVFRAGRF